MGLIDFPASPEANIATSKNFNVNVFPCVKDVGEQFSVYILRVCGDGGHHYKKTDRKDTNSLSSTQWCSRAHLFL